MVDILDFFVAFISFALGQNVVKTAITLKQFIEIHAFISSTFRCKHYRLYRVYKKNATSEFPKKTLQFLSIKDFSPLGIETELLIDHITVVVIK